MGAIPKGLSHYNTTRRVWDSCPYSRLAGLSKMKSLIHHKKDGFFHHNVLILVGWGDNHGFFKEF